MSARTRCTAAAIISGVWFSPRLRPLLIARICELDDGHLSVAEIWRRACREADEMGLERPGYHRVRTVVCQERERRAARNEALVAALAEATRWAPDGLVVLDHLAAAHAHRRPRR